MNDWPHILSFDVEEYFHVQSAASRLAPDLWQTMPSRVGPPLERILSLLAEHGVRATFFVLGWLAKRQPRLVQTIVRNGHEVASHGWDHRMLRTQDAGEFRVDLVRTRRLLEDLCGQAVMGYRAPTFSVVHETGWAIDVLAEEGFEYDSSVFPVRHDRYGVPEAPPCPHVAVGPSGGRVIELPPLTMRLWGRNLPVGGGGYLRLLPVRLAELALERAGRARRHGVVYLHPWELDPEQPRLPMGRLSTWRHRFGLNRTEAKLRRLLANLRFADARGLLPALRRAVGGREFHYGTGSRVGV